MEYGGLRETREDVGNMIQGGGRCAALAEIEVERQGYHCVLI